MNSYHLDKKFINILSSRLEMFSWVRSDLGLSRCPFCLDSQKSKTKRRFYLYRETRDAKDMFFCKCHNCGYSAPFWFFLKNFDDSTFKEYNMERFENNVFGSRRRMQTQEPEKFEYDSNAEYVYRLKKTCKIPHTIPLNSLSDDHIAVKQMRKRLIPDDFFNELLYAENFNDVVDEVRPDLKLSEKMTEEPRIIIPFFNHEHEVYMFQGRSIRSSSIRYISIKFDDNSDKVYGLERLDKDKQVYIVEGPIDSRFIDNCIASADSDLHSALKYSHDAVLIYDNQYRNAEILAKIKNSISRGQRVVLFPSHITQKDINDMIIEGGMTRESLKDLIERNTFSGLMAELELKNILRRSR